MASLEGQTPGNTFKDLLQVSNTNSGIDATLRPIEDGKGTEGPFNISTTGFQAKSGTDFDFQSANSVTGVPSWVFLDSNSPTSGSSFQFSGIPETASAILILFSQLDFASSSRVRMQVMDNGVVQTTGYQCVSTFFPSSTTPSVGLSDTVLHMCRDSNGTNETQSGYGMLVKNYTTGYWEWACFGRNSNTSNILTSYGQAYATGATPVISTKLDGVEIETLSTFSSGDVSIYYQEAS